MDRHGRAIVPAFAAEMADGFTHAPHIDAQVAKERLALGAIPGCDRLGMIFARCILRLSSAAGRRNDGEARWQRRRGRSQAVGGQRQFHFAELYALAGRNGAGRDRRMIDKGAAGRAEVSQPDRAVGDIDFTMGEAAATVSWAMANGEAGSLPTMVLPSGSGISQDWSVPGLTISLGIAWQTKPALESNW